MNKQKIFKWICIVLIIFYGVWAVIQFFTPSDSPQLVFDRLTGVLFFTVLLIINKKIDLHWFVFLVSVIVFNFHNVALLNNAALYGSVLFTIPADRIIHFSTNFAWVLVIYNIIYSAKVFKNFKLSKFWIMVIIFFFTAGVGAFTEIIEFIGYSIIGEGEGVLAFGRGDFGEWNNLSWDLISNCLGALTGIIVFNVFKFKKWIKRIK